MADYETLLSSMNHVASDGLDLSIALRRTICNLSFSSGYVQDLASSMSLFCRTLRQVSISLEIGACPISADALETIDEIIEYTEGIFDEVDDMMYRYEKDLENGRNNDKDEVLRQDFKKPKVLYLAGRLDQSKLTLAIMLQVFQISAVIISTE